MKAKLLFIFISIFIFQNIYAQRYWNVAARTGGASYGYIAVKPWSPLTSLSGSFTIECWFKADASANGTLSGRANFQLSVIAASGKLRGLMRTGGSAQLYTKATTLMDPGKWYHICCTYDSTGTGSMKFYINGSIDSTRTGTNIGPDPSPDSLLIGKGTVQGIFDGLIDDVRIWERALSSTEITALYRNTYVGALNYNGEGIVMSCNFDFSYTGPGSGLYYYDGYNDYYTRGATASNIGMFPSQTILVNNALKLDGTAGTYCRLKPNADINFTAPMTAEVWIYPRNAASGDQYILRKGTDYFLNLTGTGILRYGFGGSALTFETIPSNKWTHIAMTCNSAGNGKIYVNGVLKKLDNFTINPSPGTDTLMIGTYTLNSNRFNGYIDAVKISNFEKTQDDIRRDMLRIVDNQNKPAPPNTTVSLNWDCNYFLSNTNIGGYCELRGNAELSNPLATLDEPQSPLLGNNVSNFPMGYIIKMSDRRIPETNTSGLMKEDSLTVPNSIVITDVNFYVAIDHQRQADMSIKLFAPNGDSVEAWFQNYGLNPSWGNIITVFNDEADSSIVNGRYVDLSPRIKPLNSLNSVFSGDNAQGIWRIKIMDYSNGNTGYLNAFGLQFNNAAVFGIKQNGNSVPEKFSLYQNYPNPFNPVTKIKFDLPVNKMNDNTVLKIYDILGKEVMTLVNEQLKPGSYEIEFNGTNYPSGVYFYELRVGDYSETRRMVLIK